MTTRIPTTPMHDDDCTYKQTNNYTVGCVGCVHQLIVDSEAALKLNYADSQDLNEIDKKIIAEKISVFMFLKDVFP